MFKKIMIFIGSFILSFSLFSCEMQEFKEEDSQSLAQTNVNNVVQINEINSSFTQIMRIFNELKQQISDTSLLKIIDISVSYVETRKKENIKKVISFCETLEKLEKDISKTYRFSIIKNELKKIVDHLPQYKKVCSLDGHEGKIISIKWLRDSSLLSSLSEDDTIKTWNIKSGIQIHSEPFAFENDSPDEKFSVRVKEQDDICFCCRKTYYYKPGSCVLIRLNSKERLYDFVNCSFHVKNTKWSSDSSKLAIVAYNGDIVIWDSANPSKRMVCCCWLFQYSSPTLTKLSNNYENDHIKDIKWSPDGKCIATISEKGNARLWDMQTGQYRLLENCLAYSLEWSFCGRYIALILKSENLKIIDNDSLTDICEKDCSDFLFYFDPGEPYIAWSNNKTVALFSRNNSGIYNMETNEITYLPIRESYYASWSPCNKYLAVCNSKNIIDVYDVCY